MSSLPSSSTGDGSAKKVQLRSSDGIVFEVERPVAALSETIKRVMEDSGPDGGVIPLPNVAADTLTKVLEYCKEHAPDEGGGRSAAVAGKTAEEKLLQWDNAYMDDISMDALYDLILAANYLEVKDLLELTCQKVADMITGKTPQQIRDLLGIKNDFTPEEEAVVRKENQWETE